MEHNVKKILNMDPITDNWWKEEILFLFFDLCCEKWSDFPSLWETLEATYVKEKACTSSYMPSEARIAGQLVIESEGRKISKLKKRCCKLNTKWICKERTHPSGETERTNSLSYACEQGRSSSRCSYPWRKEEGVFDRILHISIGYFIEIGFVLFEPRYQAKVSVAE